jgi:hypothetical protein
MGKGQGQEAAARKIKTQSSAAILRVAKDFVVAMTTHVLKFDFRSA